MLCHTVDVQLCHSLPGRTRFRIGAIKRNPEAAERLASWIARTGAVHAAQASAITGSFLVAYDPAKLAPAQLAQQIQTALANGGRSDPPHPHPAEEDLKEEELYW
jgi:hypothetical protein